MAVDYESMKGQILSWLSEEGLMNQVKATEKSHFSISTNFPAGSSTRVIVYAPKSKVNAVSLTAALALTHPKLSQIFAAMPPEKLEDFKYDLYKNYLGSGPRVVLINDQKATPPGWFVDVYSTIWVWERLTKKELFDGLEEISAKKEAIRYFCYRQLGIHQKELLADTKEANDKAPTEAYIR